MRGGNNFQKLNPLSEIIVQKIKDDGPISFRDFMEMSLYYPQLGYYTSARNKIGKTGDYFTSSSFTSLFGEIVGKQIEEMSLRLGEEEFTIVEYGAGNGALCLDILKRLQKNNNLYSRLRYCIIEKSPAMKQNAMENISSNEKVTWHDSIETISPVTGCIFSNEVVDNFSVHKIVMEDELMEIKVDYNNGFSEIHEPASPLLKDYFNQLNIILPKGFCAEINLEATEWISGIAAALEKGFVITVDYGFPSSELYSWKRNAGTLTCYCGHEQNNNVYHHIGEQDITAHVNFSALHHWGIKNGLSCCGFTDQVHFLHGLGIVNEMRKAENNKGKYSLEKKMFLFQTFLMDMGSKYKILIQQKGLEPQKLSGLAFGNKISW